jgi:hypothetical protein
LGSGLSLADHTERFHGIDTLILRACQMPVWSSLDDLCGTREPLLQPLDPQTSESDCAMERMMFWSSMEPNPRVDESPPPGLEEGPARNEKYEDGERGTTR